jgi:hypothetical protein
MMARMVQVYDVARDQVIEVTRTEAATGMLRYARTLGTGSPACGEYERQAMELHTGREAGQCQT